MTALQMMNVQPNWLLFCRVGTAALACIVVTFSERTGERCIRRTSRQADSLSLQAEAFL